MNGNTCALIIDSGSSPDPCQNCILYSTGTFSLCSVIAILLLSFLFPRFIISLSLVLLLMSLDPGHYSHTLGSSTYIVWSSTESSSGCGNILEVTLGSTYLFVYCYGNELICYHKYEKQKHERSWCQLYVYHSAIIFQCK